MVWYGIVKLVDIHSTARDWGFVILSLVALIMLGWYLGRRLEHKMVREESKKQEHVESQSQVIQPQVSDWAAHIVDGAVIGLGFEFFPSRDILARHHTLTDRVTTVSTIWALWHTGTHAYVVDAIKRGNIKRLVLPHPKEAPIDRIALLVGKESLPLIQDIKRITLEAITKRKGQDEEQTLPIQERIEVRWYSGMTTNSIMIGNPEPLSELSWIQVETLMPIPANERPSFALINNQTPFESLFTNLLEMYKKVWYESIPLMNEELQFLTNSS